MGLKVTNNAFGTLNASINSSATTIVLVAGQGARFPTLSAGDYFYATLIDTSNNLEIVKVTARSTDTLTVVRAQDSTTARAYATNDRFELRPTAVMFTETIDKADAALPKAGGTVTGRLTVSVSTGHQLTLAQWGDASSADGGQTMVAGNAYFDKSSGAAKFSNSHGTIGATGIRFNSPSWNEGSLFTAGVTGSTAGNTFTPVDALLWDTAGRVRMPKQPAFQAALNGNVTNSSSPTRLTTWVKVTNSIINNRDSGFSTANGRFTAPVAGLYLMGLHFDLSGGVTTGWYASVGINGSNRNYDLIEDTTLATNGGFYVTRLIPMEAGDYAEVYMLGTNWTLNGGTNQYNTRWEGFFIS